MASDPAGSTRSLAPGLILAVVGAISAIASLAVALAVAMLALRPSSALTLRAQGNKQMRTWRSRSVWWPCCCHK